MKYSTEVLIVGGGPSGIAAALALKERSLLVDNKSILGGLSRTMEIEGAIMDFGGHSFHTPYKEIKELVYEHVPMFEQERVAKVYHDGDWIDYPFQQSFKDLSNKRVIEECALGLRNIDSNRVANNFQEHIVSSLGAGIAQHFMLPYNKKLWGENIRRLDTSWIKERVATYKPEQQDHKMKNGVRTPLQKKSIVAYPAKGGFGEIFTALAKSVISYKTSTHIQSIDLKKKIAYTNNGDHLQYERLISTMPIDSLLKKIQDTPQEKINHINHLEAIGMKMIFVVINNPVDTDIQRIYSADPHILAHKVVVNHNSSDFLRNKPVHGIVAEISKARIVNLRDKEIEKMVIDNLIEMRLIHRKSQVIHVTTMDCDYAYPVPTHGKEEIVRNTKEWLHENSLFTVGRFGDWSYINSDEALHRGWQLGTTIGRL